MAAPSRTWRLLTTLSRTNLLQKTGMPSKWPAVRPCSSDSKWQLCSAVCLERPAVVTAELTAQEKELQLLQEAMELEQSVLSDHELRHREDIALAERRKQDDYEDSEADAIRVTALEEEDAWEADLGKFTPASRTTDADKSGDKTTHDRQLQQKLTLLVQQELGKQAHWVLPQGPRHEGETMRETAERVLLEKCGPEVKARFLGNAPAGFYKYRFSSPQEGGTVGAKVFFFKAQLEGGTVASSCEDIRDLAWVTHDELCSMVKPGYRDRVSKFILQL